MKIPIVHISDIHFEQHDDALVDRADAIAAATRSASPGAQAVVVVFSGDVAYSGKASEYAIATNFLESLSAQFSRTDFVIAPGNHDCDFTRDDGTRRLLVQSVVAGGEVDESVVTNCTAVQDNFFALLDRYCPEAAKNPFSKLAYGVQISIGTLTLHFTCYNTAWLSTRTEKQQLSIPDAVFTTRSSRADIECAVTHHPNSWLQADAGRRFRDHLESTADLIFTGHDHEQAAFAKKHVDGRGSNYSEAAALRARDGGASGFTVVEIDSDTLSQRVTKFEWNGESYIPVGRPTDMPIQLMKRGGVTIADEFRQQLNELGAPFTHPAKPQLELRDLFVYPDLEVRTLGENDEDEKAISSSDFVESIATYGHVVFTGADECGKTTLAKVLFADLYEHAYRPLLIQGEMITATTNDGYTWSSWTEHFTRSMMSEPRWKPFANLIPPCEF